MLAARAPERLFVGVDANAAALSELSRRAFRARTPNLVYVRAAAEDLPPELGGIADRVTVILPWGSLLAGVACARPAVLHGIRRLCQPGAALTMVLGVDPARDQAEAARLGVPALDAAYLAGPLAAAYASHGFAVDSVRPLAREELARWPSTWARRLAHGRPRTVFEVRARAGRSPAR
ncbi:MAG TPA: class I SAM-dependent methyltransferase [Vicinamibacteria bacterium]|nr:class I SAM-dependent methyltransferase [Vicinamibacteria bacterium]